MTFSAPSLRHRCFWLLLGLLWIFALITRFWGLERFNTLVFDEIYFAKFAHNYLTQTEFFDGHPPLGKYLIGLGIGAQGYHTWGFRWMNALVGSLIPLVVAGMAFQLTHRRSYALIAGYCIALDGLLLVESRYALMNVYLLFFGLLAHWLFLWGLNRPGTARWLGFCGTGISLGATAAVKWNGLGFWLGLLVFWAISGLIHWGLTQGLHTLQGQTPLTGGWSLERLARISPLTMVMIFGAIAGLTYSLLWIPHLQQNPTYDFAAVHDQIFAYHRRVGSGPQVHPYCAAWYTWPLMIRPLSYFHQRTTTLTDPLPIYGPAAPPDATPWIFDVHAMGNPPLWWAATLALCFLLWGLGRWGHYYWRLYTLRQAALAPDITAQLAAPHPERLAIPLYLGINYAANFLPWMLVSRCTFLYHYMPAAIFSGLALAWMIDHWIRTPQFSLRLMGWGLLTLFAVGFWFWSPLYLGLPLTQQAWQLRMFIRTWI